VIVLWELAGVPVAVSGRRVVFVFYPTTWEENEVAALLLDPDVGKAVPIKAIPGHQRNRSAARSQSGDSPVHRIGDRCPAASRGGHAAGVRTWRVGSNPSQRKNATTRKAQLGCIETTTRVINL
jgi:hypothetical protein